MSLPVGTRLGPYEVISAIGAGGMGEVYRARDPRLQRDIAIKVLPPSFAHDADRMRRFEQEARVVGALNHSNIVAIYDTGRHEGAPYIVAELLEGESLREHMAGAALSQRKAIEFGTQIARGLAAAHEKGVVHRDLKPDNVFVLHDGRVKILDFGLAKLVREEAFGAAASAEQTVGHDDGTSPGQVLGTVGYMSPEQVKGLSADHRTDIFALGTILYEMLTGQRAFKRDSSVETLSAILKEEPPELEELVPNLTPGLDRVVRHCLEKSPAQRFQSASDVAFDLETISSHSGSGSRLRAVADQRRSRWWQMAGVVVALLALTAAYFAGKGQTAPAMSPRFHQLTFQRGSIFGAKFAPDGQSILYSAAWNGAQKQQVYTTRTDALMSRAIDLPDSQVASISSKGEMAILRRIEDRPPFRGVLAIVPLTGGAPRELMADVVDAAWSPSGDSLAVVNVVGPEQRLEYPVGKVIHRTSTGGITDLKVSPDGKRVAFFDHPNFGDSRGFVAVVDAAGKVTRLTQEWADLTGLAWSNSGKEVWFTGSDVGINSALYAVELSGRMRDLLHIPGRLHLFDIGKDGQVLMTNEAQRQEVYARRMGQERETDLSWFDWTLGRALSQDSQWIVLEEDGEGGGADYTVFLRKTDGSPAIRLGNGMGLDISPDAKWVASTPVKQPAPTVLLPTGAGQPMSLGDGALFHTSRLKFLPDGKSVIMIATQPGGAPRTYLQQLDSSPPKPFGPEGFTGTFVSPDGRYVLGRKDGAFGIVAFADSMKFQPVSIQPSETVGGWTADSRSVYVGDNSSMPVKVYAMDIGTGQRHLHHQHSPGDLAGIAGAGTGLVTPDGKFYAYTVARVLSYLYVVRGLQ